MHSSRCAVEWHRYAAHMKGVISMHKQWRSIKCQCMSIATRSPSWTWPESDQGRTIENSVTHHKTITRCRHTLLTAIISSTWNFHGIFAINQQWDYLQSASRLFLRSLLATSLNSLEALVRVFLKDVEVLMSRNSKWTKARSEGLPTPSNEYTWLFITQETKSSSHYETNSIPPGLHTHCYCSCTLDSGCGWKLILIREEVVLGLVYSFI
jgi:hypothetical protein